MTFIPSSLMVKKIPLLVGIFLVATLITGGTVRASFSQVVPTIPIIPSSTSAQTDTQESPILLAMSSLETTAHELPLKAVKLGEQVTSIHDFKIDVSNVIGIPLNGKLTVFSTENIQITNVKLTNTQNQVSELTPVQNVISLSGFPQGVYTLDVIVSKDGGQLAYEGILVVGQSFQNAAVNQVIEKETKTDVRLVFEMPKQRLLGNDPCNYHGLNLCDSSGNCDDERFDCYSDDCVNGQPGTTGQCDGDDDKVCWVNGEYTGKCEPKQKQLTIAELPPCDGSYQDCVTPRGDVCEAGSGAHECEVEEPEPEVSCQEEDDFCEPGCESPSMDCIDDVNIGDDGEDSTSEEESGDEEEETANCGGEPCTPTEKEDSWTDEEEEEEESNNESSGDEEGAADEEAADEGGDTGN